ncbi:MAG TPA: ImmA/IrrE family metallo-endopeptidase [Pyrinomonadaceae bacterium]|jgi:Zn-dependent peptidase ImmA (M78 family)
MFKLPNSKEIANRLLEQSEQVSPPVNLEKIISLWSELNLEFDELEHEGYLIDLGGFGKEIVVRSTAPIWRQRFTIAHEIGHLVLEENNIKLENCISFRGKEYENNFIEKWCDSFAASLLMPEEWILRDLRRNKIKGLVQSILELPNIYNVSNTAFRRRISEISPLSIFDVKQTDRDLFVERLIERKYESNKVKKIQLGKTLEELLPNLEYSTEPIEHINYKTKMLSVYSLVKTELESRKWMVCIFPNSKNTNEISIRSISET